MAKLTLELFEFILLMLATVALSNLINRFIPSLSVPIIQIILGMTITLLPLDYKLTLNPELFLVLFIAPLLFYDGRNADKKSLWELKKPILLMALGLVFMTVLALGYFMNWLLPIIPLAASFALAAALAPTDAIAVGALEEKIKIPHQTMKILEGESLINDASGLVSFQFAVAAMVTGAFSLKTASISFVLISLGGIVLGLMLTLVKYVFVRWLRRLGMENVTLHMLIELLTPFAIFLLAEELGVNGILAVVSAGIAHSLGFKKLHPEIAKLNIVSKSTWSVIAFVLNGLVFLLLGTQLPDIIQTIWSSSYIGHVQLIFYSLLLTVALLGLRMIWVLIMNISPQSENQSQSWQHKLKNALILSLSGVRGTITLASTMSLPFILDNGNPFPARDLIIFLASGVIVWTLLGANYLLPLLLKKESQAEHNKDEIQAKIDMLRNVIAGLHEQVTDQNKLALSHIIGTYAARIQSLQMNEASNQQVKSLTIEILKWERKSTLQAINNKSVNPFIAHKYLTRLNKLLFMYTHDHQYKKELPSFKNLPEMIEVLRTSKLSIRERRAELNRLRKHNIFYILDHLKSLLSEEPPNIEIVSSLIARYERELILLTGSKTDAPTRQEFDAALQELSRIGIQLERDQIQSMFEAGRISRSIMKELKNNLWLMEHDLKEESNII
ncbi:Na+/H+ antiporter [Paenibacillus sp. GCM10028914]|uniref:Na+/H+ antiporter n=1 Tax=Paenibacillus sp. GCM10028914 TaxID=3273416 RepID=UPI003612F46B